jgi:ankyrin repeat protein
MHPASLSTALPAAAAAADRQAIPSAKANAGATTPAGGVSQPLLYQATTAGDIASVRRLLAAGGIDANVVDPDTGMAALTLAARQGHDDVALLMVKGRRNSRGDSAPVVSPPKKEPGMAADSPAPEADCAAAAGSGEEAGQGGTLTTAHTATTVTTIVITQPGYAAPAMLAMPANEAMSSLDALRKAVARNDLAALRQVMATHPDARAVLNQPIAFAHQRGMLPAGAYTLLMLAATHGHRPMVEALLALGADPNARSGGGSSALLLAVGHRQIDTAEALLKAGAEVDAQAADGGTAVMLALARRDAAMLGALLESAVHPGDINACLRLAAARGHVNTVRLLLKAGAQVNAFDDVLHKKAQIDSLHALRQGIFPEWLSGRMQRGLDDYYDSKGMLSPFAQIDWAQSLALTQAVRNGHATTARVLLDAGAAVSRAFFGQTLILHAAAGGQVDIMRMLLDARRCAPHDGRANRSAYDSDCVESDMRMAFMSAIGIDQPSVVRALLDMPEGRRATCSEPVLLARAVRMNRPGVVRLLLEAGADPDREEDNAQFPLVLAFEQRGRDIVSMLLDAGARPELARRHRGANLPLLHYAAIYGDASQVRRVLSLGAGACGDRADLQAAFRNACLYNNAIDAAQCLLDAGADLDGAGDEGLTALHLVAEHGRTDRIAFLLGHKAQVDMVCAASGHRQTPLMRAVVFGHAGAVRLLLEAGARRDLQDSQGRTALQLATQCYKRDIAHLLNNWAPPQSS